MPHAMLIATCALVRAACAATTLHVSLTGNDNGAGTQQTPLATVTRAIALIDQA